jgi:hypothetical protein
MGGIVSKKKFGSEGRANFIARRKVELRTAMERISCPKGILKDAIEGYKIKYGLGDDCNYGNMYKKMGSGDKAWHTAVAESFDMVWDAALAAAEEKAANSGAEKETVTKKKDDVELRTMTTSLRQVLRPDLAPHYNEICLILERKQQNITNVMQDLAAVLQKAVIVVRICNSC